MSGSLIPNAKQQFLDANGNPLAGGFVYFYIPSTTTFKNTYQNAALSILNTNPIILDSAGEAIIYGNGSYRQIVTDVNGNLIWDQTTVSPITLTDVGTVYSASNGSSLIGYTQGSANAVSRTVQNKLQESVSVLDFGAVGDGVTDDTVAIQAAVTAVCANTDPATYGSNTPRLGPTELFIPAGLYKITNAITATRSISIKGEGHSEFSEGTRIIQFTASKDHFTIAPIAQGSSVSFTDLTLTANGNGGTSGACINITKAAGVCASIRIIGCTFGTPQSWAIKIQTADDVMIYDNLFDVSAGNTISLGTTTAANVVTNCCIRGNTFYAISLACVSLYNVEGLIIAENRVYPVSSGFTTTFIEGTNTLPYQIKNVTVIGNKLSGVYALANLTVVNGFNITGNTGLSMGAGTGATLNCITFVGTCTNVNITGNILSGTYDTKNFYNDAGATITNANISGNAFYNIGGTGRALYCSATSGVIDSNSFVGFAIASVSEKKATTGNAISPGVIAANDVYTATITVPSAKQGDTVIISTPNLVWIVPTGIFVLAFVSAADTISIQYNNPTSSAIGVPAHDVLYKVIRG